MKYFKVDTIENIGDNWLVADFGVDSNTGKHYILTTDHIHASEVYLLGTVEEQVNLVCKLLNAHYSKSEQQERMREEESFVKVDWTIFAEQEKE